RARDVVPFVVEHWSVEEESRGYRRHEGDDPQPPCEGCDLPVVHPVLPLSCTGMSTSLLSCTDIITRDSSKRHVVVGRLQQRSWTAEDGSRSLTWLPAVVGHGASLNGGYRSVTRT